MKNFYKAKKDSNIWTKQQTRKWEKSIINSICDRGLICKLYKELKKLDIKKKLYNSMALILPLTSCNTQ